MDMGVAFSIEHRGAAAGALRAYIAAKQKNSPMREENNR
jgi:hypothetical protein